MDGIVLNKGEEQEGQPGHSIDITIRVETKPSHLRDGVEGGGVAKRTEGAYF